jgi:hypothetical protein
MFILYAVSASKNSGVWGACATNHAACGQPQASSVRAEKNTYAIVICSRYAARSPLYAVPSWYGNCILTKWYERRTNLATNERFMHV